MYVMLLNYVSKLKKITFEVPILFNLTLHLKEGFIPPHTTLPDALLCCHSKYCGH